MKERPILFSAPMVRAILDGRKTQTRRVVKPGRDPYVGCQMAPCEIAGDINNGNFAIAPYGQTGDRLWVREAYRLCSEADRTPPRETDAAYRVWYEADAPHQPGAGKSRPGMFMPRWASRITLEITAVRVERLQDISEADALAEGVQPLPLQSDLQGGWFTGDTAKGISLHDRSPQLAYRKLWNSINGPGSWDTNPWVWVLEFKRV